MIEKPEAIMINVPKAFFIEKGSHHNKNLKTTDYHRGLIWFERFYDAMGTDVCEECSFYHFISTVPVQKDMLSHVFICYNGFIQYKALIVEFIKKSNCADRGFANYPIRDWVVTTGPVIKPREPIKQKGFRGFRYCKMHF